MLSLALFSLGRGQILSWWMSNFVPAIFWFRVLWASMWKVDTVDTDVERAVDLGS